MLDIATLKAMVLNPGYEDKEGLTVLDRLADEAREKTTENITTLIVELIKQIRDFNDLTISRLFAFTARAGANGREIAQKCVDILDHEMSALNIYQRLALIRYVQKEARDLIQPNHINIGLARLKTQDPWTFIEICAVADPFSALNFTLFHLNSDKEYDSSAMVELILIWLEKNNPELNSELETKLLPLLEDDEAATEILKFKLLNSGQRKPIKNSTRFYLDDNNDHPDIINSPEFGKFIKSIKSEMQPQKNIPHHA